MTSLPAIQVKAYTRWHQLSVPLGFLLSAGAFMTLVFVFQQPLWAIVAAVMGLVLPPLTAFQGFPTKDAVIVQHDRLAFERRDAIPFAQIKAWGTDDYLKLVRHGQATILVSALDGPNRERLLKEFPAALAAWQKGQAEAHSAAKLTHFYGTWRARTIGLLIIALGAVSAWMALRLQSPNISLALVGGLGCLFGISMLLMKRR